MPNPVKLGSKFYLRVQVPRDLKDRARDTFVTVPVGHALTTVKVTTHAKVSLRTGDRAEARQRFPQALAAVDAHWEMLRAGPQRLSHKDTLALAGEVRADFVRAFDEEPGDPAMWDKIAEADRAALEGRLNPLAVPTESTIERDLEKRFGGFADVVLRRHALVIDQDTRLRLLRHVVTAMKDARRVNVAKACGDYSDTGETKQYPNFSAKKAISSGKLDKDQLTFSAVIDTEVAFRKKGRGANPLPANTESKFRKAVEEFAAHRGSEIIATVTPREADAWMNAMLEAEEVSVSTVKQRIQNLKTVIEWARKRGLGEVFPDGNPVELVTLPKPKSISSADRTFRLDEARTVLQASRTSEKRDIRWLPWLCAYSGARINEVAQLRPDDFFRVGEDWFFRLTTRGGRSIKNQHSIRRVPVHPDVIAEGLLDFVFEPGRAVDRCLFPKRSALNVRDWIRHDLGLTRVELAPNHGWRHLFEDLAMSAGMSDTAKSYITGRSRGSSDEGYGKSDVMLAGLAREMGKIGSLLEPVCEETSKPQSS
jgi:integrase